MPDPKVDEMLLDFLSQARDDRKKGYTPEAQQGAIHRIANELQAHAADDRRNMDELRAEVRTALTSLAVRVTNQEAARALLEKELEDTGNHLIPDTVTQMLERRDLAAAREALAEKKALEAEAEKRRYESRTWVQRYGVQIFVGFIVLAVGVYITNAVTRATAAAASPTNNTTIVTPASH